MPPIRRTIRRDAGAVTQVAEKEALVGIDHDSHMTMGTVLRECHQVSGLRMEDSSKLSDARIKLGGSRILVRKSGLLVDGVNQVRAVVFRIQFRSNSQRSRDDGEPVIFSQ